MIFDLVAVFNPGSSAAPVDYSAIAVGFAAAVASLGAGWLALKGKRINPTDNGLEFISTEAQKLAKFHREDAERSRLIVEQLEAEIRVLRAELAAARKSWPPPR